MFFLIPGIGNVFKRYYLIILTQFRVPQIDQVFFGRNNHIRALHIIANVTETNDKLGNRYPCIVRIRLFFAELRTDSFHNLFIYRVIVGFLFCKESGSLINSTDSLFIFKNGINVTV